MEKKKIDRIIETFRRYISLKEEIMTANPIGKGGGIGGQTDPSGKEGPAGFDPVMYFQRRGSRGPQIKLPPGQRKRWKSDQK